MFTRTTKKILFECGMAIARLQVRVQLRNTAAATRPWKADSRLQHVRLRYRQIGTLAWSNALNSSAKVLDFLTEEQAYGFAELYWDVSSITDGRYEIQAYTQCTTSSLTQPVAEMDTVGTPLLVGRIDRAGPRQFGFGTPADGSYAPGKVISVTFDEQIDCSQPYSFRVTMMTSTNPVTVIQQSQLLTFCEARTLFLEFGPTVAYSTVNGRRIDVMVHGIRDLAQNVMQLGTFWSFTVPSQNLTLSSVTLQGLLINIDFNSSLGLATNAAAIGLAKKIATDVATFLGVNVTRVTVFNFRKNTPGGVNTVYDITFSANNNTYEPTATELAARFVTAQQTTSFGRLRRRSVELGSNDDAQDELLTLAVALSPEKTTLIPHMAAPLGVRAVHSFPASAAASNGMEEMDEISKLYRRSSVNGDDDARNGQLNAASSSTTISSSSSTTMGLPLGWLIAGTVVAAMMVVNVVVLVVVLRRVGPKTPR